MLQSQPTVIKYCLERFNAALDKEFLKLRSCVNTGLQSIARPDTDMEIITVAAIVSD